MTLLLDTQALLWWLGGELNGDAQARIADPETLVVVSVVTIWEAEIKQALGKLTVPEPLAAAALEDGFEPLAITFEHAERAAQLPAHHRDPFDRMLIAQAQTEGLTVVTRDRAFSLYDVPVLSC